MPKRPVDPELDPSFVIDSIKRRKKRLWLWELVFLLLIPLGVAIPFAISAMTENRDALQYSGMAALAVVLTGLCGFVLLLFNFPGLSREMSMAVQAERIGFRYANESEKESFANLLKDSRMFVYAADVAVNIALLGEVEGHSLAILGIDFVAGGDVSQSSAVVLAGAAEGLPEFLMFPLGWFEKLASKVMKDPGLKLPGEEEFNRVYKLRGEDKESIIEYFNPKRIKYSLSETPFDLESKEGILIASHGSRLKDLEAMVEMGSRVRKRFGA